MKIQSMDGETSSMDDKHGWGWQMKDMDVALVKILPKWSTQSVEFVTKKPIYLIVPDMEPFTKMDLYLPKMGLYFAVKLVKRVKFRIDEIFYYGTHIHRPILNFLLYVFWQIYELIDFFPFFWKTRPVNQSVFNCRLFSFLLIPAMTGGMIQFE